MITINTHNLLLFQVLPYVTQESDGSVWGDAASKLGNISERLGIELDLVFSIS